MWNCLARIKGKGPFWNFIAIPGLFLVLAFFSGCDAAHRENPGPAPLVSAGASFSTAPQEGAPLSARWYDSFGDGNLTALIEKALGGNMDVRQAMERLEQARAFERQARASFFPAIGIEGRSEKEWRDEEEQQGTSEIGAALSWEADAFGRLRAASRARHFESRAAAEDVEALRLDLAASVAESWFGALAQQSQLELLRQQADADKKFLGLVTQRLEAGIGTNVEVLQQRSQLAESESLIPESEAALRVFENRLDVLTGSAPDAKDRTVASEDFSRLAALPAVGVPSDLLLNRPDLRAMRNRLVAADADIAAAIADRLPRLTLDGSHIYSDGPVAGTVTSLVAGLVAPLLDWGSRRAEVTRREAIYKEDLAAFTQAWLEAVEDVENALYQENRQREFIKRLETRRDILQKTVNAAESVYTQGESDYLPVLDSLQNLRVVERSLIAGQLDLVLYRIRLFRALGSPLAPAALQEVP